MPKQLYRLQIVVKPLNSSDIIWLHAEHAAREYSRVTWLKSCNHVFLIMDSCLWDKQPIWTFVFVYQNLHVCTEKVTPNKVGSLKKMDNNPVVWSLSFILQLPCIQLAQHTVMTSVPGLVGRGTRTKLDVASEVAWDFVVMWGDIVTRCQALHQSICTSQGCTTWACSQLMPMIQRLGNPCAHLCGCFGRQKLWLNVTIAISSTEFRAFCVAIIAAAHELWDMPGIEAY